jgi:hypothetical protein
VAAFFCALLAGVRAVLAVIDAVLPALRAARLTDFRAQQAQLVRELRIAAHEGRGLPTKGGTVAIEPDAIDHARDIALLQAGTGAVLAVLGTGNTGIDTRFELMMCHDLEPPSERSCADSTQMDVAQYVQNPYPAPLVVPSKLTTLLNA